MALSCWVYMIEDDEAVARSLAVLLTLCGYQALRFPSADSFLGRVHELSPGRILMDYDLPGADGLDALDELRRRNVAWPLILMTGHDVAMLPRDPRRPWPCRTLEKPFDEEQLCAVLDSVAGQVPRATGSAHSAAIAKTDAAVAS